MSVVSFVGRVLFASLFIFSAWQEFNDFGTDGGLAAKNLKPKFNFLSNHIYHRTGSKVPEVEIKHLVSAAIFLKGAGGLLFILGSYIGAYFLLLHQAIATAVLYDFYNYEVDNAEFNQLFVKFTEGLALLGALLFYLGMKNSIINPRKQQAKKKGPKTKTT